MQGPEAAEASSSLAARWLSPHPDTWDLFNLLYCLPTRLANFLLSVSLLENSPLCRVYASLERRKQLHWQNLSSWETRTRTERPAFIVFRR